MIEQRHIDVLHREIVVISARLTRLINDAKYLKRALRDVDQYGSDLTTKEEVQSESVPPNWFIQEDSELKAIAADPKDPKNQAKVANAENDPTPVNLPR